MMMDFTRPLTYQKVRAGVDEQGKLVAVDHDLVSAWPTARWASGLPDAGGRQEGRADGFAVHGADF